MKRNHETRNEYPMSYKEWMEKEKLRKMQERERQKMKRVLLGSLADIPVPWLIIGLICLVFSLFTCIL